MNQARTQQNGKRKDFMGALAVLLLFSGEAAWADAPHRGLDDGIRVTTTATVWEHSARCHDGTVWAWGYNGFGQVADVTASRPAAPAWMPGLVSLIAHITRYVRSALASRPHAAHRKGTAVRPMRVFVGDSSP